MKSPQAKIAVIALVLVAGTLALIVLGTMKQAQVTCEVCITFHGRQQCRTAVGPDEAAATRTATDNACAFLASGMTDTVSCSQTPPDRITCGAE